MTTSLESVLLLKDESCLEKLCEVTDELEREFIAKILQGKHLEIIESFDNTPLSYQKVLKTVAETGSSCIVDTVRSSSVVYLKSNSETLKSKSFGLLVLGITFLELYCQCNYTGPELANVHRAKFELSTNKHVLNELECDGYYPYQSADMPQFLLIARALLSFTAVPFHKHWKEGILLDAEGNILIPSYSTEEVDAEFQDLVKGFATEVRSSTWWHARAVTYHARLLQKQNYDSIPRLWEEAVNGYKTSLAYYGGMPLTTNLLKADITEICLASTLQRVFPGQTNLLGIEKVQTYAMMLQGSVWLEWGLTCHHFVFGDKGKKAYYVSKETIQLETKLTAALGKRTKYQRQDIAQLYLYAKSSIVDHNEIEVIMTEKSSVPRPNITSATTSTSTEEAQNEEETKASSSEWQHGEWELGKRLVSEGNNGEEAAVREVLLDSIDGGPAENIILEGGPHFQDPYAVDEGGALHPIDQALILALCLDVCNSNPVDGLTNEEMAPYIERILQQANNWMIHSTGLLERSWLEFERRKTMDRAMLQIQALIDQHSTKLTIMQSSYKSIEDSAPVQDRLRHLYQVVYPSQFELKRDLAIKYLRCQVFMSALNYFKELEMWDEVVTCYQLIQKPHRAELVVREQLKISETPYMITSLADLTGKEELYEHAWKISQGRFPRAKRTLGKICYDRGDFANACKHLSEALKVQPLVHTAWYLKGLCCMRLEWWEEGLQAFVRCIQQDMEVGEAWANMGAIHMHMKQYAKADHCLVEALKQKHNDWRILENLLTANIALSKWKESIRYMSLLIDQRHQSQRPVHIRELRYLTMIAVTSCKQAQKTLEPSTFESNEETTSDSTKNEKYPSEVTHRLNVVTDIAKALETLLDKITTTLKSEPDVWDIVAEYHFHLGQYHLCLEARIKQFRAIINAASWEKNAEKVESLSKAADFVIEALHFQEVKKEDLYSCRMLLQSTARKLDRDLSFTSRYLDSFAKKVQEIEGIEKELFPRN